MDRRHAYQELAASRLENWRGRLLQRRATARRVHAKAWLSAHRVRQKAARNARGMLGWSRRRARKA